MADGTAIWHRNPDVLGGTPVFVGTRVPVASLFDYLRGGDTIDEFLRQFPSVKREQVVGVLRLARDAAEKACTEPSSAPQPPPNRT